MRQKGFVSKIILILTVLGILSYFVYKNYISPKSTILGPYSPSSVITETTNPTANWKTYVDQYFSIKYPDSVKAIVWSLDQLSKESKMNVKEDFENLYHETSPIILSSLKITSDSLDIWIYAFENKNNLSTEQWSQKNDYYPENFSDPKDQSIRNIVYINGLKANMGTPEGMFYSEAYLIPSPGRIFLIYTHPTEQKTLVDQILSTFKIAQ